MTAKKKMTITRMMKTTSEDLQKKLHYLNLSTVEEFYTKQEEIKLSSWHKYDDIVFLIEQYKKLRALC